MSTFTSAGIQTPSAWRQFDMFARVTWMMVVLVSRRCQSQRVTQFIISVMENVKMLLFWMWIKMHILIDADRMDALQVTQV